MFSKRRQTAHYIAMGASIGESFFFVGAEHRMTMGIFAARRMMMPNIEHTVRVIILYYPLLAVCVCVFGADASMKGIIFLFLIVIDVVFYCAAARHNGL